MSEIINSISKSEWLSIPDSYLSKFINRKITGIIDRLKIITAIAVRNTLNDCLVIRSVSVDRDADVGSVDTS